VKSDESREYVKCKHPLCTRYACSWLTRFVPTQTPSLGQPLRTAAAQLFPPASSCFVLFRDLLSHPFCAAAATMPVLMTVDRLSGVVAASGLPYCVSSSIGLEAVNTN
jgi:hypothetical protein